MMGTLAARFFGLRHHAIVCRHDQDDHVGDLRTAGAHERERFVTGGVEKYDVLVVFLADRHEIRADVLRDAAGFAFGHTRRADRVEQRRLAVIDVAHHGDDRGARNLVFGVGGFGFDFDQLLFEAARLNLRAELTRDLARRVDVDRRVDRHHHPAIEQRLEHVLDARIEPVREILDRHAFSQRDRAADRRRFRRRLHGARNRRFATLLRTRPRRPMRRALLVCAAGPLRHAARTHLLRRPNRL
jgi:hypothetical protein